MYIYRTITSEEITNLYKGKSNSNISIIKGENTHNYQPNTEYIHFFRYSESAEFYHEHSLLIHNPHIAYMIANVPKEILKEYLGYGYYNGISNDIDELITTTVPLPEYAIPKELFKLEYIVEVNKIISYEYKKNNNEYNNYLKLVSDLMREYDYNHFKVARILTTMNLEEILQVEDSDQTKEEILKTKIKTFNELRQDLFND